MVVALINCQRITVPNCIVNALGEAVWDILEVPLEDQVENLGVEGLRFAFFEPVQLYTNRIEYLSYITLTTYRLMASIEATFLVPSVPLLLKELEDELNLDDWNLAGAFLPGSFLLYPMLISCVSLGFSSQPRKSSDINTCGNLKLCLQLEYVRLRHGGRGGDVLCT